MLHRRLSSITLSTRSKSDSLLCPLQTASAAATTQGLWPNELNVCDNIMYQPENKIGRTTNPSIFVVAFSFDIDLPSCIHKPTAEEGDYTSLQSSRHRYGNAKAG